MIELLCAIAVIYVAVDLLGSMYVMHRFGGIRATIQQIKRQWDKEVPDDPEPCEGNW